MPPRTSWPSQQAFECKLICEVGRPRQTSSSLRMASDLDLPTMFTWPIFRLVRQPALSYQCKLAPGVLYARAMVALASATPSSPSASPIILCMMAHAGSSSVEPSGHPKMALRTCRRQCVGSCSCQPQQPRSVAAWCLMVLSMSSTLGR